MRTRARYAVLLVVVASAALLLYITFNQGQENEDEIERDNGFSNKKTKWTRQRHQLQPDPNGGEAGVDIADELQRRQQMFNPFGKLPMQRRRNNPWSGLGVVDELQQYRAAYTNLDAQHGSSRGAEHVDQSRCTPRHNITFLKVHKTGSSTLQNIFLRYGQQHKLTFVLPPQGHHLGFPQFFNRHHMLPTEDGAYNIFCHHTRFSQVIMEIMPPNAIYISILRDPVRVFESAFTYFKIDFRLGMTDDKDAMTKFLDDPVPYYKSVTSKVHMRNNMLFDFGFPTVKYDDIDFIRQGIDMIDKQFSLILIAEYFEESLILLRDALCWQTKDMVVFKMNSRSQSSVNPLQEDVQRKIRSWNDGDVMLYDYFNKTLWRKIDAFGRDRMAKEVKKLQALTADYYKLCIETDSADRKEGAFDVWQPPGVKINAFVLKESASNNPICENMVRPEIVYTAQLRETQFPHLSFRKFKRNMKRKKRP